MTASTGTLRRLVAAAVISTMPGAAPALAADTPQDLFKDALALNQEAPAATAPEARDLLLRDVDALLARIVAEPTDSRLAEILESGQPIGRFSRKDIHLRLAEAEAALTPEARAALQETRAGKTPAKEPSAREPSFAGPSGAGSSGAGSGADGAGPSAAESWPQPLAEALTARLDPANALDAALLESLRVLAGEPVRVGAPPVLERGGEDRLTITLTDILIGHGADTARLDRLSLLLERRDAERIAMTADMSPELHLNDGVLRFDAPAISGVYNTTLALYPQFRASLTNLRALDVVTTPEGATQESLVARLDSLSLTETFDDTRPRFSGEARIVAKGLTIMPEGADRAETDRVALKSASFVATMTDVDRNGYLSLVELVRLSESVGNKVSEEQVVTLLGTLGWRGFGVEGRLEGAEVVVDGMPVAHGGSVALSLSGDNDGGTGDMRLSLAVAGIGTSEAGWALARAAEDGVRLIPPDMLFTDLSLVAALRSVPYTGLLKAAMESGGQAGRNGVEQVLQEAGTHLVLEDMVLEAPEARIAGTGAVSGLRADGLPPTAEATLTIAGLDRLTDHIKGLTDNPEGQQDLLPVLVMLKGMGRTPEDPEAAAGLVYDVVFDVGRGGFTVNGMPMEALLGGR